MTDEEKKVNEDAPKDEANKVPTMVDEAKAVRDEILKAKEELKTENDRKEKIKSEELLSSSAGGHIESAKVSPEDKKVNDSKEFFKGTQLEKDIEKANEKK